MVSVGVMVVKGPVAFGDAVVVNVVLGDGTAVVVICGSEALLELSNAISDESWSLQDWNSHIS